MAVGDGEALLRCMPDASTYNPIGMVHGGLLCTLLDSAAGCAVHTRPPAGARYASIEIKVSYLQPVRADQGAIEVLGRALRVGRRVACALANARDTNGALVGHATTSNAVSRLAEWHQQVLCRSNWSGQVRRLRRRRAVQLASAVQPPSTGRATPLMNPLRIGSARNATAAATSSGVANRPMGTCPTMSSSL